MGNRFRLVNGMVPAPILIVGGALISNGKSDVWNEGNSIAFTSARLPYCQSLSL